MEREDWIKNRTDNPEKIGKLWWNKMYNQCCLPIGKTKDPVPQDIERKMFAEYLEHNKQAPDDSAKWLDNFGTRGVINGLFRDVDGKTVNESPENIKITLDMAYKLSTKNQQQNMQMTNVINSAKQSVK